MQAFTLTSNVGLLRRLNTNICVKSDYRNSSQAYDINTPWNAVWDTGATHTCISKKIRETLDLVPIGETETGTAGGLIKVKRYLVDILLPNDLIINNLQVIEVDLMSSGCDVLIGMDVITLGDFSLTNFTNKTVLSFRTPSCHCIDYVGECNNSIAEVAITNAEENS